MQKKIIDISGIQIRIVGEEGEYADQLIQFHKMNPIKFFLLTFSRRQWPADTKNKVDISGEQQSWYFCTFFMTEHILI